MKDVVIAVACLLLLSAVWAGWTVFKAPAGGRVACTTEAKLCPDGSYVGRTGPTCEFAPCPPAPVASASGIEGKVMLGPTCPVERIPPDPQCAEKPYAASFSVMAADGVRAIKGFKSAVDGTFKVDLPPGTYVVRSNSANMLPRCADTASITVAAGAYAEVAISCDTGIR